MLFLHERRTEGCSIQAAVKAYCAEYMDIFEWLIATSPDIMNLDAMRENMDDNTYFASYLLDEMDQEKRHRVS